MAACFMASKVDVEAVERWLSYCCRMRESRVPLGPDWVRRYWTDADKSLPKP